MSETCSNCKFWSWWRTFSERQGDHTVEAHVGHCVVETRIATNVLTTRVQGLTGDDFHCASFKEKGFYE